MMISLCEHAIVAGALIPLIWSSLLEMARWLARSAHRRNAATERSERVMLLLMIVPTLVGLWLAGMATFAPNAVPALPSSVRITIGSSSTSVAYGPDGSFDLAALAALGATITYFCGALRMLVRFVRARLRLRRVIDRSIDASATWGEGVGITAENVPPFAGGRSRIILPDRLIGKLSPVQTHLVVRHELAHVRRRDPRLFLILASLEIAFWFNPIVRRQIERCRLAAELACDAEATEAAPALRKTYAESLILALKYAAGDAMFCAAVVLHSARKGDYQMRIAEIMRPSRSGARQSALTTLVAGLLLAGPVALLQASFVGATVPNPMAKSGLPFLSPRGRADRIQQFDTGKVVFDGHATMQDDGIDVRANRITLASRSAAEFAHRQYDSLLAEGAVEIRLSAAAQKALENTTKFTSDKMQFDGNILVLRGNRVNLEDTPNQ